MASGLPGWYPDPGGEPGQYRYWDGQAWSDTLSPTPYAPAPYTAGYNPGTQPFTTQTANYGQYTQTSATSGQPYVNPLANPLGNKKKFPLAAVSLIAVAALAIILVLVLVVPKLGGGGSSGGSGTEGPVVNPTTQTCPTLQANVTVEHPNDGWVHGGRLAFPELGPPWEAVQGDDRVPFGRDVREQFYYLHSLSDGTSWVASVLVGELYAGDGFYSPQEGAEIVTRCIQGEFYSDATIEREDTRNEAYSVDGYDGWIIETWFYFEIAGLPTTSEQVTIIVVATSEMSSSLFYSSVPGDSPDAIFGQVAQTIDSLKVSD
jgi:hypothetical protein